MPSQPNYLTWQLSRFTLSVQLETMMLIYEISGNYLFRFNRKLFALKNFKCTVAKYLNVNLIWKCGKKCRAGNLLIPSSLISLKSNERLWVIRSDCSRQMSDRERNRSGCSEEMSDCEWFAQVAQRKWAMWANRSFCLPNMSQWAICSKTFG